MAPQKIGNVRKNANVIINHSAMEARPELAVMVAHTIAIWAEVESSFDDLLVAMLGAAAGPTLAMYQSLTSTQAQAAALDAAASEILGEKEKEIFDAVMAVIRSLTQKRHPLVHWSWGISPELPDALLLQDPRDSASFMLGIHKEIESRKQGVAHDLQPPDFSRVYVYRKSDFESLISEMHHATISLLLLRLYLMPEAAERDDIYHQLLNEPGIREALRRLRARRQKNHEPPEPPLQKDDPQ